VTYCLAIRLDEGLVFLSDTRTNAGVDNVSTYRKLFTYEPAPDRTVVVQSAGNLATTQEVLDRVGRDLADPAAEESLATVADLSGAALYLGRLSRAVVESHADALAASGADGTATFLVGGQIGAGPPDILLVYPEGNSIHASEERPFLQIGEAKYGKFLLELIDGSAIGLRDATKIALSSMISTARANVSVGPPYDLGRYEPATRTLTTARIEADSPFLAELEEVWSRHLDKALAELPLLDDPAEAATG
jgi:putative proteasome-type protease